MQKLHTGALLDAAVERVRSEIPSIGPSTTLRSIQKRIADELGVKLDSLERRMRREECEANSWHGARKLTENEEKCVIGFITAVSIGTCLCLADVAAIGNVIYLRRIPEAVPLSTGWAGSFLQRNLGCVKVRALKPSEKSQKAIDIWRTVVSWSGKFESHLQAHNYRKELR